jgi:pilus assembly protein Flp/PilA
MKTLVSRFMKDESGATAIEYGLIAAGISVAIIAVVQGLGTKLTGDVLDDRRQALSRTQATDERPR